MNRLSSEGGRSAASVELGTASHAWRPTREIRKVSSAPDVGAMYVADPRTPRTRLAYRSLPVLWTALGAVMATAGNVQQLSVARRSKVPELSVQPHPQQARFLVPRARIFVVR